MPSSVIAHGFACHSAGVLALAQKPTQLSPGLFGVSAYFGMAAGLLVLAVPGYVYILRHRAGRLDHGKGGSMVCVGVHQRKAV
jgi:hypothetical protein